MQLNREDSVSAKIRLAKELVLLRKRRGYTTGQAVYKSSVFSGGITNRSVERWEAGEVVPQWENLSYYLEGLNASAAERELILGLLDSREGAIRRNELIVNPAGLLLPIPGIGDLLHAVRIRNKLSKRDWMTLFGVSRGTLRKLETSESLPTRDFLELLVKLDFLNEDEKQFLNFKSRVLPPVSALPLHTHAGIDALTVQIDELECLGIAQVDFPGDLTFLAIEAALAPYVRAFDVRAARLLARTYVVHAEWLERRNCCEGIKDYVSRSLEIMSQIVDPLHAIPKADTWWAHAAIMRVTCDVRDALQQGVGRQREQRAYRKVLEDLSDFRELFKDPRHLLEIDRCRAGYFVMLSDLEKEEALPLAKKCVEQALLDFERDECHYTRQMLLHCRLTVAHLLRGDGQPDAALEIISEQEQVCSVQSSLLFAPSLTAWLVRRKAESLKDAGAYSESRSVWEEFCNICTTNQYQHLMVYDPFDDES